MAEAARRGAAALVAFAALALVLAASAPAQVYIPDQRDPFNPREVRADSPTQRIQGYPVNAGAAADAAERLLEVQGERERNPGLTREVHIPTYLRTPDRWIVDYDLRGRPVLEIEVSARTGEVVRLWTGYQIRWLMARGTEGAFGRSANSPYIWLPLCLLFLVPFFDPGRPLRLLHLDLLVLLGFGVSLFYFNAGEIETSVPLAYPPLLYLMFRALLVGFRGRESKEALVPWAPTRLLLAAAVVITGFKIGLDLIDGYVIDVGFAGIRGADRITHGLELYVLNEYTADVYGPVNYLVYVPFLTIFGWSGDWDYLGAARAAAIAFDVATLAGSFVLGTRLRPGPQGRALGAALAYGWASFPFSTYVLQSNSNDSLVAALVVWSLVALRSDAARGVLTGLGGMVKFAPLILIPLLAAGLGDRRPRRLAVFAAALLAAVVLSLLPFIPAGGLREFYDTTIGFQAGRDSPFSVWGQDAGLEWAQTTVTILVAALACALFFVPRRREPRQVCALAAALMIAIQLPAQHWFYLYLVWFIPPLLAALFTGYTLDTVRGRVQRTRQAQVPTPA